MNVEFNLSNIIFVVIALISAFWALAKLVGVYMNRATVAQNEFFKVQFSTHEKAEFDFHALLARRLDGIEALHREDALQWQRVERELLLLKADLPLNYVRREDYVQAVASILVKLDSAQLRHENLLLKGLRP